MSCCGCCGTVVLHFDESAALLLFTVKMYLILLTLGCTPEALILKPMPDM